MRPAKPYGCRVCRQGEVPGSGGTWEMTHDENNDRAHFSRELSRLRELLPAADANAITAEIRDRMKRASSGDLKYGRAADVEHMAASRVVLELRLPTFNDNVLKTRQIRLYFAEPAHQIGVILGLKLATKIPASKNWKRVQNEHIQTAQRRADAHYLTSRNVM